MRIKNLDNDKHGEYSRFAPSWGAQRFLPRQAQLMRYKIVKIDWKMILPGQLRNKTVKTLYNT